MKTAKDLAKAKKATVEEYNKTHADDKTESTSDSESK